MNPTPIALLAAGLFAVGIVLALVALWEMRRFLERVDILRTTKDIVAFKRVAGRQMYLALTSIALDVVAVLILLVALPQGLLKWEDLLLSGPLLLAFWLVFPPVRAAELEVQRMPVSTAELHAERERVVQAWKWRLFPNW